MALSSNLFPDYFRSKSIKSSRNQMQAIMLGGKHPYPPINLAVLYNSFHRGTKTLAH